ncbi:hypothetical protein [Pedobacter deserti]|uniref:hypothetical protein n=1 Tax=Pedobacter deserti TaxID=2817382 RepID=UPI00210B6A81|nr:hypothetical protein [Pedobacter sp. SYSU D00382]
MKCFLFQILLLIFTTTGFAQVSYTSAVLDQEPYFARYAAKPSDSLFQKDIQIIRGSVKLDSIDAEILKAPVLAALLVEQVRKGKPATYRTIIEFITLFKTTPAYQDFRTGVLLYKKLEAIKVNLDHWDDDKMLFVRLGWTENDLEDFKSFIEKQQPKQMTYKDAYVQYMKEIESL